MACCIKNCLNFNKKCPKIGLSYHAFPKEKDRASKWLEAIGSHLRTDVDMKKLGICSIHFDPKMVDDRRLRWQAAPCYFDDTEIPLLPKNADINHRSFSHGIKPESATSTTTLKNIDDNISTYEVQRGNYHLTYDTYIKQEIPENDGARLDYDFFDFQNDPYIQNILSAKILSVSQEVVKYLSGYVVHKLKTKIICKSCIEALEEIPDTNSIAAKKTLSELVFASNSVLDICLYCEEMFRTITNFSAKSVCKKHNDVLRYISEQKHLFENVRSHMFETSPEDNHFIHLVKAITETYFKVRHFYYVKKS